MKRPSTGAVLFMTYHLLCIAGLLALVSGHCEEERQSFSYPIACNGTNCYYRATWKFDESDDSIKFTIEARQSRRQWTGIGFSKDARMTQTDAVIGTVNNGRVFDAWLQGRTPKEDTIQNLDNPSISYFSDTVKMSFTRKRVTNDTEEDFHFGDEAGECYYFFFPVVGGIYEGENLLRHTGVPVISTLPICIRKECKADSGKLDPRVQPTAFSPGTAYASYLWVEVKDDAPAVDCAKLAANVQEVVKKINDNKKDKSDKLMAGVGFGRDFYSKIGQRALEDFFYPARDGEFGSLPSTGGDIFFHGKGHSASSVFELVQEMLIELKTKDCIKDNAFWDTYSFVYGDGRDLSGFIDGTENPATEQHRLDTAVEPQTGGSYVVTQVWEHEMDLIQNMTHGFRDFKKNITELERWIGRNITNSAELRNKDIQSHVSSMTGGDEFERVKPFEIVRQSMPFGSLSGKAGLNFIGYAKSTEPLEFMMKELVGENDGTADFIMKLSKCVKGTYWYFPSNDELKTILELQTL